MVRARLVVARNSPDIGPGGGVPMEGALEALLRGGIKRVYLGFPIWNEAPSAPAQEFVRTAALSGVTVVPFYTYLHYVEPASLERLGEAIRAGGGTPIPPLGLPVPLSYTDAQVACLARRTLLAHPEAWPWSKEQPPVERCAASPSTGTLCSVPAGWAWVGDTSEDCAGQPPRATRVGGFEIQQAEVTIAEYEACSGTGKCPEAAVHDGIAAELVAAGERNLPVPGVSHAGASAYCAAHGMRLPTEAEWIRAGGVGTARIPTPGGPPGKTHRLAATSGNAPESATRTTRWPTRVGPRTVSRGSRPPALSSPIGARSACATSPATSRNGSRCRAIGAVPLGTGS